MVVICTTGEINSFDQYAGHAQQTGQYRDPVEPIYLTRTSRGSLIDVPFDSAVTARYADGRDKRRTPYRRGVRKGIVTASHENGANAASAATVSPLVFFALLITPDFLL